MKEGGRAARRCRGDGGVPDGPTGCDYGRLQVVSFKRAKAAELGRPPGLTQTWVSQNCNNCKHLYCLTFFRALR